MWEYNISALVLSLHHLTGHALITFICGQRKWKCLEKYLKGVLFLINSKISNRLEFPTKLPADDCINTRNKWTVECEQFRFSEIPFGRVG